MKLEYGDGYIDGVANQEAGIVQDHDSRMNKEQAYHIRKEIIRAMILVDRMTREEARRAESLRFLQRALSKLLR